MLKITQNFVLLGIALGPFPLLQELLVPGEAVNVGVGVAPRAGVAVPVPGAAYRFPGFIDSHLQSQFVPQRLQHVEAGKTRANHDSVKVLNCATHLSLQCCLHRRQRNSILRKSGEPRSCTALCAASSKAQTPLSGAANVRGHLLSANGSICIRTTPEILREVTIQIIVAEAGSADAGGVVATSGRSEPCFACRTSRFNFF